MVTMREKSQIVIEAAYWLREYYRKCDTSLEYKNGNILWDGMAIETRHPCDPVVEIYILAPLSLFNHLRNIYRKFNHDREIFRVGKELFQAGYDYAVKDSEDVETIVLGEVYAFREGPWVERLIQNTETWKQAVLDARKKEGAKRQRREEKRFEPIDF